MGLGMGIKWSWNQLCYVRGYRLSKVVKKMKLETFQNGGHDEQPSRLK